MSKFTSRKFIIALLSAIGGVAISLSSLDGKIGVVCAIISAVIPPITYIVTEGIIDAKAIDLTIEAIEDIEDIFDDDEEEEETDKAEDICG